MNTKWLGLWAQERQGFYAGQVVKKGYESKCVPIEIAEDERLERLYTEEEVYQIIHGMQSYHGLPYGDDLIEDFI